jgi:hypothetical protein
MSFKFLMPVSHRLSVSVETLAALGCTTAVLQNGLDRDSRARALLNDVAEAIDPRLLDGAERKQQAAALALIQTLLRKALDLLENPELASSGPLNRTNPNEIEVANVP